MKILNIALAAAAALTVGACTTVPGQTPGETSAATEAAIVNTMRFTQLTLGAWCALTPEGRAELRKGIGLDVPLYRCPNDPVPAPAAAPPAP